jgi:isocitrate dehydrogenase
MLPNAGEKITRTDRLNVPDQPIIPLSGAMAPGRISGRRASGYSMLRWKKHTPEKKIAWFEVFAGQTAKDKFDEWLPDDTVEAFREYLVESKDR